MTLKQLEKWLKENENRINLKDKYKFDYLEEEFEESEKGKK